MIFKKLIIFLAIFFTATKLFAAEISNHQYNFFTGNFDFSDEKASSNVWWVFNTRMKIYKEILF